jgi:NAD(P)H-nitrite reductase large subunit
MESRAQGEVVDIQEDTVVLDNGNSISFDAMIIATGSYAPFPVSPSDDVVHVG